MSIITSIFDWITSPQIILWGPIIAWKSTAINAHDSHHLSISQQRKEDDDS
jgi:hypothetical protein